MRLIRYQSDGQERAGVLEGEYIVDVNVALALFERGEVPDSRLSAAVHVLRRQPAVRDLTDLIARGEDYLHALSILTGGLAQGITPETCLPGLFTPLASARLLAPIARPPKIVCVGLNYADHAREQGIEAPQTPIFFLKSGNTVCHPGDPIRLPPNSSQVDYEAELAVVIGKGGRSIDREKAYEHVAGYMAFNDVTARDMQFGDKQWYRGKSCDTFAPSGPWIVTRSAMPDPHRLGIVLTLNGQTMQDSNTRNLIFDIPYLISYLSQSLTWEVGDIIATGTPPGVGVFRKPPVFLRPGDTVSVTIEGIGTLTNPVAAQGPA
jgi:2-keto-4-pentenoate hydratase/2-oxohepta-3-ene-1,7-dioic acid hydratase in catechol pathway